MKIAEQVSKLAGHVIRRKAGGAGGLRVTSSSFTDGGPIPDAHAGERGAVPTIAWGDLPPETKEVVVLCEDPDAPQPKPFVHWSVYGLPPQAKSLPDALDTAHEGKNSAGREGFFGPKPPRGHGIHHYHFQVFALDRRLGLGQGADRDALVAAMQGHVLESGEIVGTYEIS